MRAIRPTRTVVAMTTTTITNRRVLSEETLLRNPRAWLAHRGILRSGRDATPEGCSRHPFARSAGGRS